MESGLQEMLAFAVIGIAAGSVAWRWYRKSHAPAVCDGCHQPSILRRSLPRITAEGRRRLPVVPSARH